jgi:HSP20 family protein
MYHHQAWAAKGQENRYRHLHNRSAQRAAVNIFKTENSYEILVFAPGRFREHFHLDVKAGQLTVSYQPPDGLPRTEWILREYSRGGFERTFNLDAAIDTDQISARYEDGVLRISLPLLPGNETAGRQIVVG